MLPRSMLRKGWGLERDGDARRKGKIKSDSKSSFCILVYYFAGLTGSNGIYQTSTFVFTIVNSTMLTIVPSV